MIKLHFVAQAGSCTGSLVIRKLPFLVRLRLREWNKVKCPTKKCRSGFISHGCKLEYRGFINPVLELSNREMSMESVMTVGEPTCCCYGKCLADKTTHPAVGDLHLVSPRAFPTIPRYVAQSRLMVIIWPYETSCLIGHTETHWHVVFNKQIFLLVQESMPSSSWRIGVVNLTKPDLKNFTITSLLVSWLYSSLSIVW